MLYFDGWIYLNRECTLKCEKGYVLDWEKWSNEIIIIYSNVKTYYSNIKIIIMFCS